MEGFNDKLFTRGETVAVALSGGEDSVCLLFLLKNLENEGKIKLTAVNVEHGIRGQDSVLDTEFCKKLCKELSVPLKTYSVDTLDYVKKHGVSVEEGARKLRYECFYDAVKCGFCDKIACAHHQADNIETVLFNIFRGTSVSGLRGMEEVSSDGVIVRPLLRAKKEDISSYIENLKVEFVKDKTNEDVKYTRNYIRKKILPLVVERFPGGFSAIERLSYQAKADDDFLYSLAKKEILLKKGNVYIPRCLPYSVFSRATVFAFKTLGVEKDFDNGHIASLFNLKDNQSGKKVDLLGGLYGVREGEFVVIKKKKEKTGLLERFSFCNVKTDRETIFIEPADGYKKDGANYVDYDKIPNGAVIRKRKAGDIFYKFGGGKVSLKKFLTDKKIPADEKDELFLIAKDDIIYVIIGVEISSLCRIDENTARVAKITVKNH